jgi:hypothetical protein
VAFLDGILLGGEIFLVLLLPEQWVTGLDVFDDLAHMKSPAAPLIRGRRLVEIEYDLLG